MKAPICTRPAISRHTVVSPTTWAFKHRVDDRVKSLFLPILLLLDTCTAKINLTETASFLVLKKRDRQRQKQRDIQMPHETGNCSVKMKQKTTNNCHLLHTPWRICRLRHDLNVNQLEQWGHWWVLTLLCMFTWSSKCSLDMNPLPQMPHTWAGLFKWVLSLCRLSPCGVANEALQNSHNSIWSWPKVWPELALETMLVSSPRADWPRLVDTVAGLLSGWPRGNPGNTADIFLCLDYLKTMQFQLWLH